MGAAPIPVSVTVVHLPYLGPKAVGQGF